MIDAPICEQCGPGEERMTPCFRAEDLRIGAWWCQSCGWVSAPIGRERLITEADWEAEH